MHRSNCQIRHQKYVLLLREVDGRVVLIFQWSNSFHRHSKFYLNWVRKRVTFSCVFSFVFHHSLSSFVIGHYSQSSVWFFHTYVVSFSYPSSFKYTSWVRGFLPEGLMHNKAYVRLVVLGGSKLCVGNPKIRPCELRHTVRKKVPDFSQIFLRN